MMTIRKLALVEKQPKKDASIEKKNDLDDTEGHVEVLLSKREPRETPLPERILKIQSRSSRSSKEE